MLSSSSSRALSRMTLCQRPSATAAGAACIGAPSRLPTTATTSTTAARATVMAGHGVRGYAQAAPQQQQQQSAASTKPPVPLFGIDGTYASALYTAAAKTSSLEPTAKALAALTELLKRDRKLPAILQAPTLSVSDKGQIVNELVKHTAGADKSDTVKNLLKTLAENNRLGVLEGVCEKFGMLMSVYRGEVELLVTSAAQLDSKTLSRLEAAISKSQLVGPGKKLKVVNKVNPDILGGLIVEVGDKTIDLSVSSKVARLNKLLRDTL